MKMWPTCTKTGLQDHLDEYVRILSETAERGPFLPARVATVYNTEKDREINKNTHKERLLTLDELIKVCRQEIKEFD